MPRRRKPPLSFVEQMKRLSDAQLERPDRPKPPPPKELAALGTVEERVKAMLGLLGRQRKNESHMIFFVMYDIQSNKVRTLVHKYLKRKGCVPIQRSIFLADTSPDTYNEIRRDLTEVQQAYDNEDSIVVLPVTTDYLRMMKVIGKHIAIDVITQSKSTIFF